jgi:serine/threonine protein kinase
MTEFPCVPQFCGYVSIGAPPGCICGGMLRLPGPYAWLLRARSGQVCKQRHSAKGRSEGGELGDLYLSMSVRYCEAHTELTVLSLQVEHEARLHLRLLHPHVVRCYAYLEDVTHTYLVMEYAEQGDLRKALHTYTERNLRDSVVQPLLQALSYIHSKV